MDIAKLIDIAKRSGIPDLVTRGAYIASDVAEFAALVKANAARGALVLAEGDQAQLDAIHAEALGSADALDAKLSEAAKR